MFGKEKVPSIALIQFDNTILIGKRAKERPVNATKYSNQFMTDYVWLIPKKNVSYRKHDFVIAYLPVNKYNPLYFHGKSVFSVKTSKIEDLNGFFVVRDTILPREFFDIKMPENKGLILVREPNQKNNSHRILMRISSLPEEQRIIKFLKDSFVGEIEKDDGLIKIKIEGHHNDNYLEKILANFKQLTKKMQET